MEQTRRESDRLNDEERESYLNQIPGPFKPEELNVSATDAPAPVSPRPQGPKQFRDSKRSNASRQNTPILMRQKKDKINRMETQFLASHPPVPPRTRPFLCIDFPSEQTLSACNNDPESFHCAIGPILAMAQLFGILPISGICRPNPSQLKFVIFSFRTAYTVFINVIVLVTAIRSAIKTIRIFSYISEVEEKIVAATDITMFYGSSVISMIIFFWLSSRWTTLQCDWRSMEQLIDSSV